MSDTKPNDYTPKETIQHILTLQNLVRTQQETIDRTLSLIDVQTESIRSLNVIVKDHGKIQKDLFETVKLLQKEIEQLQQKTASPYCWKNLFKRGK